jgi:hypothetical protein
MAHTGGGGCQLLSLRVTHAGNHVACLARQMGGRYVAPRGEVAAAQLSSTNLILDYVQGSLDRWRRWWFRCSTTSLPS